MAAAKRCHSVRLTARCCATRSAPIASTSSVSASSSSSASQSDARRAQRGVDHVESVAALGRAGVGLVLDAEACRLQHGGQRDVDRGRSVAQAVLEAGPGTAFLGTRIVAPRWS